MTHTSTWRSVQVDANNSNEEGDLARLGLARGTVALCTLKFHRCVTVVNAVGVIW